MKTFSLFILSLLISIGYLSGADWNVQIARYKQDKACAISYTFDDGLAEHYTLLVPQLEKRGFRGTFWVCGSNINKDNENITDTTRMTWPQEIKEDIFKNDSAIFANTGVMPRTFCYPNNNKKAEGRRIAVQNRVGTRTHQRSIGSKSTLKDLEKWVNTLIETNDWGVGMTHGLTYGYDAFRNPQRLWDHLDQVKARENEIWVGTFREVVSYIKEREETKLEVVNKKNTLLITPELKLDQELFVEPLTMVITGKEIKKVTVKQGKRRLPVQITDDKVLFDFDPYGGMIKVTLKIQK